MTRLTGGHSAEYPPHAPAALRWPGLYGKLKAREEGGEGLRDNHTGMNTKIVNYWIPCTIKYKKKYEEYVLGPSTK